MFVSHGRKWQHFRRRWGGQSSNGLGVFWESWRRTWFVWGHDERWAGIQFFKIATTTRTHKTTWSLVNKPEEESILPRTIHKTLGMHQATRQAHTQASTIGEIPWKSLGIVLWLVYMAKPKQSQVSLHYDGLPPLSNSESSAGGRWWLHNGVNVLNAIELYAWHDYNDTVQLCIFYDNQKHNFFNILETEAVRWRASPSYKGGLGLKANKGLECSWTPKCFSSMCKALSLILKTTKYSKVFPECLKCIEFTTGNFCNCYQVHWVYFFFFACVHVRVCM